MDTNVILPHGCTTAEGGKNLRNSIFKAAENKEPMSKKPEADRASSIIKFRIKGKEKVALQAEAKGRGISLTELVKARIHSRPVRDRIYNKALFESIDRLTREMNSIGNNINQSTVAIHQIKNG